MRNNFVYRILTGLREYGGWVKRGYSAPSPHFMKQACLLRNGFSSATWVETGTFLGQTTQLLAKHAPKVYSVEPESALFARACKLFSKHKNVEILNGTSEDIFPKLLPTISGDVNFWLDGHYSAGITFRGSRDTPVLEELACIARNLSNFGKVCILIDDIRCFNPKIPEYSSYPDLNVLVAWAAEKGMIWHVEHDIFIAKTA